MLFQPFQRSQGDLQHQARQQTRQHPEEQQEGNIEQHAGAGESVGRAQLSFWALMDKVTEGKALELRKELKKYHML